MKNITVSQVFKPIGKFLRRINFTLLIVVISGGLAVAVLMLNTILEQSSTDTGYVSDLSLTSFDQTTIDQLDSLTPSTSSTGNITLPTGRINPFSE